MDNLSNCEFVLNDYIDAASAAIYIGISEELLRILTEKKVINIIEYSTNNHFKIETELYRKIDLDNLILKRKRFSEYYYSEDEFNQLILAVSKLRIFIIKHDIPPFACGDKFNESRFCIKKSECQSFLEMRNKFIENHYSITETGQLYPRYV